MHLLRIDHQRCLERDTTTFCFAPDGWNSVQIHDKLAKAQDAYLKAVKAYLDHKKETALKRPGRFADYIEARLKEEPEPSIGEMRAQYQNAVAAYKAWEEDDRAKHLHFRDFLREEGFISIWDEEAEQFYRTHELDWGHHHGWGLQYDEQSPDNEDLRIGNVVENNSPRRRILRDMFE